MKRYLAFRKAYHMYVAGQVWKDGESDTKVYYTVTDCDSKKDHQVTIEMDNQVLKLSCDCTVASIKSKHLPLCSHMMAAIQRSVYELGKPKRRKKNEE